jgi:hypothetical protein
MKNNPRRVGQDATGADELALDPRMTLTSPLPDFQLFSITRLSAAACFPQKLNSDEDEHEYVGIRAPVCGAKNKSISPARNH